ncbi:hypothetical protein FF38_07703, partial [Lucilia cuprina]
MNELRGLRSMKANAQIALEEQERLKAALGAEDMGDVQISAFNKKKTSFNAPYSIVFHDSIKTLSKMNLKPNAYKIVLYMFSILQMGNIIINFSQKKIAEDLGLQQSNVSRAFKELFEKKILIKDSENGHVYFNSNIATIGIPKNFNKQTMDNLQRSQVETEEFKNTLNLTKHSNSKKIKNEENVKETHAKGVISEARRDHGFTSHIEHVEAPKLLYGTDLNQLEQLVDHYSENAFIYDKNNKKKKLRADASVLLGGVISLDRKDIDQWEDYKKDSINYLKSKYKDNLKTIIEHTDEAHPHIHFYVIAPVGQLINNLHEGKNAVLEAKKNKHKNQQSEYIKAMTKFQDDFYERVSKKYGFSRI